MIWEKGEQVDRARRHLGCWRSRSRGRFRGRGRVYAEGVQLLLQRARGCQFCSRAGATGKGLRGGSLVQTSSHSAPAVSRATNVSEIPSRRATMAVFSMKASAPYSRRQRPATKADALKRKVSQSIGNVVHIHHILGAPRGRWVCR